MKFNLMKEEITIMLTGLNEQFESMDSHQGKIPYIEMDIFLRNIQKLYEDTIYLKKLNESFSSNNEEELVPFKEVKVKIANAELLIEKPIEESVKKDMIINETPSAEKETDELQGEILMDLEAEESVQEVREVESSFDDMIEQANMEGDLFSQMKTSAEISDLNKKLAEARHTHSIVEKLQNNRIENLKSVIGINDKFYFINELFSGNAQKYEDIIYTLNNFKKLDDAMQYFSTLKYRFNWDEESEPFAKLVNMLERKFNMIDA